MTVAAVDVDTVVTAVDVDTVVMEVDVDTVWTPGSPLLFRHSLRTTDLIRAIKPSMPAMNV